MTLGTAAAGSFVVFAVAMGVAACGGNSNNPSGARNCSSVSVLGSPKGTVNATINGTTFRGGVATGGSTYVPVPPIPSLGLPALDSFTFGAVCGDTTQLIIGARATLGQTNFGHGPNGQPLIDPATGQPFMHNVTLLPVQNGVSAGSFVTNILGGSGSITVNSVSSTAASGSFNLTMIALGAPATGTRLVTGTFNVTF